MADCDITSVSKLDCSICLSRFKDPKLLTCFHTFCLQCLEEYVIRTGENGKFECPLCRTSMAIPVGGVRTFQSNFYIEVEGLSETSVDCDLCGNGQKSSHYCIECEEHFCERCAVAHSKMKITRDHKMVQLNDTNGFLGGNRQGGNCQRGNSLGGELSGIHTNAAENFSRKVQKKSYCPHHNGEEIKMTCKDCNVLLCVVCKLTEHENHCTAGIAKEASERRTLLSQKLAETQSTIKSLKLTIGKVEKCADGIQKKLENDVKEIDERVEQIVKQIKDDSEKMKQNLRISCTEALVYYVQQKKMLHEKVNEGDAVVTHAQNVIDVGDDINVLDTCLLTKLNYMKATGEKISVKNMTYLTFKASKSTNAPYQIGKNIQTKNGLSVHKESTILNEAIGLGNTIQNNVLAVSTENIFGAFLDFSELLQHKISSQATETQQPLIEGIDKGTVSGLTLVERDVCYFSHLTSKSVYKLVGKQYGKKVSKLINYPFGLAYRVMDSIKQLLVCVQDTSKYCKTFESSSSSSAGCVMAVPINITGENYVWRDREIPGPTCIAVSETNGLICLGYPTSRKVTLNSPNGSLLSEFTGDMDFGSPEKFCPTSVCFDKDMGIIIADYGNDAVIRTDGTGIFLQCLIRGNKPLSVAVGKNGSLYVGFMLEDITQYQLKAQDTL
ncbi:uncharacterized protein LOC123555328 [Mercenaria mercenaria]|uniref:uncharacterized protein LOC123555328 n=1 Tax=Mercenaria mercenaria TaxID=6596 RepID=UPI00234E3A15|nr:uncharacterized protein LOC123555328 [Mercenaria mercenaria]